MFRKMTPRTWLQLLLIIALLDWTCFLLFSWLVAPTSFLAFLFFFLLLAIALVCTSTLLAYFFGTWAFSLFHYMMTLRIALRQGSLFSLVLLLNLIFLVLKSWNVIMLVVLFFVAVLVEVASLAKKQ